MTGADIKLTDEQVDLVHRLQKGQFGDVNFNPYEVGHGTPSVLAPGRAGAEQLPHRSVSPQPAIDFFTHEVMIHPVTNRPADKRSFIPSLIEKEKVRGLMAPWSTKPSSACAAALLFILTPPPPPPPPPQACGILRLPRLTSPCPTGLQACPRHQDGLDQAP